MSTIKAIQERKGTILDVRTPSEYMGGNVSGSVNIPLQEIEARIAEVKALQSPLILCCASGGRSAMATQFLAASGFECFDGGSWLNVNYHLSQAV
jgi:rhodanese-related sulfurtransferase